MAKIRPEGMKTSYKYRTCWGTWKSDDEGKQGYKLNIMSNEDRIRLGLDPIEEKETPDE